MMPTHQFVFIKEPNVKVGKYTLAALNAKMQEPVLKKYVFGCGQVIGVYLDHL